MKNLIAIIAMLINFINSIINMSKGAIDKAIYFVLLAILMAQIAIINNTTEE